MGRLNGLCLRNAISAMPNPNGSLQGAWRLISLPLWRVDHDLLSSHMFEFLGLRSKFVQSILEQAHGHSEVLEVVQLGRKTDRMAIDEHPVTRVALHLVDLEGTLSLHGNLELCDQVLSQAHLPA